MFLPIHLYGYFFMAIFVGCFIYFFEEKDAQNRICNYHWKPQRG